MKKSSLIFTFLFLAITANSHYCMGADESKEADNENQKELEEIWTSHNFKHFPSKNKGWSKGTVKRTKTAPAKYMPGLAIKELEEFVIKNGTLVNGAKVMEFNDSVGATSGRETDMVRVETNGVNFHGQPYTPEKVYRAVRESLSPKAVAQARVSPFKIKKPIKTKKQKRKPRR